jgi:RHH-type proline utilization regulon transcriptional repressor/proline dehydrogenase/delta 1-pyrroline-5-carboxylate dehydrogenase
MTATLKKSDLLNPSTLAERRARLRAAIYAPEEKVVEGLLESLSLSSGQRRRIVRRAADLVSASRGLADQRGTLDAFLQEFGLSNKEGVALMCLAEALLRVPDGETADKLIAEKIASGRWQDHQGQSESLFVNASTWALMLTGQVVDLDRDVTAEPGSWLKKLVSKTGEPIIRAAMMQAMRIMGGQYVMGRNIAEAISRADKWRKSQPNSRHSFDMLGEGARTDDDARRYFESYAQAIEALGRANKYDNVFESQAISVKFSALHPRYEYAHRGDVMAEMLPRILDLAKAAKSYNLGFSIDAEEARRLDISLDIFEALARAPELAGWPGLGLVIQAYQKRAPLVVDWVIELARDTGRHFMIRLVKGAYWDSEIKRAQEYGLSDYPVYTRKANTDLSYLVCAEKLLAATDVIFPQFATHNAHTVAAIAELAGDNRAFEFQRLHGMGELLYSQVFAQAGNDLKVRLYAPVGAHRDLLPYLVRRLLENGANSSFVNRFMDETVPVDDIVRDPVELVESAKSYRHTGIPLPLGMLRASGLAATARDSGRGMDLTNPLEVEPLLAEMAAAMTNKWQAAPLVGGAELEGKAEAVLDPSDHTRKVGACVIADPAACDKALALAAQNQRQWDAVGGAARAEILEKAADLFEAETPHLMALIVREAGRTIPDALSEVREAVDFLRYYALQARAYFETPTPLPGPTGEKNELSLHGRGTFLCISPWNFPLAIFTGQVAAALAAGNAVLAKPAEQTPLVGAEAVRLMLKAGVPTGVLHLTPGDGKVGAALVADERVHGVAFTGSTETARAINRALAARGGPIATLIAETGGQNAMFVDTTALPEQVVDDVVSSAFISAGQRCSALRVLFLQDEVADKILEMLAGAMDRLTIGDPAKLNVDIGPVIDEEARAKLVAHAERMKKEAKLVHACDLSPSLSNGTFFAPHVFELKSLAPLEREVFGPILHVLRYKASDLDRMIDDIRKTGYGLTLGVHSRIEATADYIFNRLDVGNTYINRNMVGAVVGVQPFGGHGLSGTGPKAGGPHYLMRFASEKTRTVNTVATGGNAALFCLKED